MSFGDDVVPDPPARDLVAEALELVALMGEDERAELAACLVEPARPVSRQSAEVSQAFARSAEVR
jgi:hypothetical protein